MQEKNEALKQTPGFICCSYCTSMVGRVFICYSKFD